MQYDDDSGPLSASMIFPFAWPEGADDELSGTLTNVLFSVETILHVFSNRLLSYKLVNACTLSLKVRVLLEEQELHISLVSKFRLGQHQ